MVACGSHLRVPLASGRRQGGCLVPGLVVRVQQASLGRCVTHQGANQQRTKYRITRHARRSAAAPETIGLRQRLPCAVGVSEGDHTTLLLRVMHPDSQHLHNATVPMNCTSTSRFAYAPQNPWCTQDPAAYQGQVLVLNSTLGQVRSCGDVNHGGRVVAGRSNASKDTGMPTMSGLLLGGGCEGSQKSALAAS